MDERFVLHRLKSTRFATLVGVVMIGVYFEYLYIFKHEFRLDLFIFLMAMGVSKLLAMLYYRKFH